MQADALAGLLTQLDMSPAVIIGGSGGARVSLLTAARHRQVVSGLATWWVSGGVYGLMIACHSLLRRLSGRSMERRHASRGGTARMVRGSGEEAFQLPKIP